jgi:carnitine 3-dehydrogenase
MKNVTCYGTGVIGTAWGATFLKGGCNVVFFDIDQDKLDATKTSLIGIMDFFIGNGMMASSDREKAMARASYTTDPETAVRDADFIQENCPENIPLKRKVLKTIETYCRPDAIIASSTSGLLPSQIAAEAVHPERVIVGHPYNPVYMMPLVEICRGEKTSDAVAIAAKSFYKEMGKEPVVLNKECPGFICNRIQVAVGREAYNLVDRGICSVEDVDNAIVYGVGLRWAILGPHLVSQLGGGAGGFRGLNEHLAAATSVWLKDMATWTEVPEEYIDKAEKGIAEEMAHRAPGKGQTNAELASYLGAGAVAILKYHGKL